MPLPEALHPERYGLSRWLPVISLAVAAFIFTTSEFVPVGLLLDIASSFHQTGANTGLMMTIYAWVVSLMSLPLTVLTARLERRRLMMLLLVIFVLSHIASGMAASFGFLVGSRIGVALSHSVFWSIATPLAARVAPHGKKGQALAAVITATSLATVLGVPLGTMVGHQFGWRWTFWLIGAVALLVFFVVARLLPITPSQNSGSLASLPVLLRRPALLKIYALTVLTVTGHFALYSYIRPFFETMGGFSPATVVILLLVIGGAGIPGSYLSGRRVEAYPIASLFIPLALLLACLTLAVVASRSFPSGVLLCLIWGSSMTAVCLSFQTQVLNASTDAADVAVAMYSGIFNIGIGGGALLGSQVIGHMGLKYVGYAGGAFVLVSLMLCLLILLRRRALGRR